MNHGIRSKKTKTKIGEGTACDLTLCYSNLIPHNKIHEINGLDEFAPKKHPQYYKSGSDNQLSQYSSNKTTAMGAILHHP